MENKNEYGSKLRQAREALGMIQRVFGGPLGLNEANIKDIETGRKKLTPELATQIEEAHGINMRWLLTGKGEMFLVEKNGVDLIVPEELQGVRVAFDRGEFEDLTQDEVDKLAAIAKMFKEQRRL